jgi:HD-GYP domain-containing protein (c-di-GMP phosphodiesterase class II)
MPTHISKLFSAMLKEKSVNRYLTSLKEHHLETYQHSLRVGKLCLAVGTALELATDELKLLGLSGLLHDIGKRKIPASILSKRSALDPEEKEIMKSHPRLSLLELGGAESEIVRRAVVTHHEYKSDPYPRKGKERRADGRAGGRRMPSELADIFGQIVAVADIYDALASRRSYKPPLPQELVETELRKQFTGDKKYLDLILQVQSIAERP